MQSIPSSVLLNDDLFILICNHIQDPVQLIGLELVSRRHMDLIRKTKWSHFLIYIKSEKILLKMLAHHTFLKIDMSMTNVTDTGISKLSNCHTLHLMYCLNITDDGVSNLGNCYKLDLSKNGISDKSISKLVGCRKLNLSETFVTDECLYELHNCRKLNVHVSDITSECIIELKKRGVIICEESFW